MRSFQCEIPGHYYKKQSVTFSTDLAGFAFGNFVETIRFGVDG